MRPAFVQSDWGHFLKSLPDNQVRELGVQSSSLDDSPTGEEGQVTAHKHSSITSYIRLWAKLSLSETFICSRSGQP